MRYDFITDSLEPMRRTIITLAPNAINYLQDAAHVMRAYERGMIVADEAIHLMGEIIAKAAKTESYNREHRADGTVEEHYYDPKTGKIKFHRAA